ncbi:MAG: sulfatase-like hydrolase/transferase [Patescibacteria group bacterium]
MAFSLIHFPKFYFNLSVCAASRVTMFTGLHASHHGVWGNSLAVDWTDGGGEQDALGVWLQAAGYKTALFGKYLNRVVTDNYVANGYDEFRGMVDDSNLGGIHADHGMRYVNFWLSINGTFTQITSGDTWTGSDKVGYTPAAAAARIGAGNSGYQTDWLNRRTQLYLDTATEPFYLDLALWSPHSEASAGNLAVPATRHASIPFTPEHDPNWDEADIIDKPKWLRDTVPSQMTGSQQAYADDYQVAAWQAALGVDELLYDVVAKLTGLGMIDRTIIMLVADNGAMDGGHRLTFQTAGSVKNVPYEESAHSQLFVHYPAYSGRHNVIMIKMDDTAPRVFSEMPWLQSQITATNMALIGNIDIVPTICDAAKAKPTLRPDGMSLVPLLDGRVAPVNFRDQLLIEYDPAEGATIAELPTFAAVITASGTKYIRYSPHAGDPSEDEHYELSADSAELINAVGTLTATQRSSLDARVESLKAG